MKISTLHNETPLGSWTYSEWRPPHLAGTVEVIWYFKGPTSSERKRVLPNGMVEMLVNFGEPYRTISGAGPELMKSRWIDPAVAWAAGRIEQSGGAVSIAELRRQTGLSKTRLAEAFRDQIGLAPKLYARVVRFRRAPPTAFSVIETFAV
jgi:hypothetical protein